MKLSKTNQTLLPAVILFCAAFCMPNTYGQVGYDTPNKTDTFNAGPEVYHVKKKPSSDKPGTSSHKGPTARLRRGEIVQVMTSSRSVRPELAFYLPPEATSIVQLVVERRGSQMNFFLKGLSSGSTVGGAVQREWLDSSGYKPRSLPDEARIQAAVRRNPLYIEVQ